MTRETITRNDLWTADECADYLGFTTRYFKDKVSRRPDFPKPNKKFYGVNWVRRDVEKWASES